MRHQTTFRCGCSVFLYCVIVFTAVIFAKSNSPTYNCNNTVVNWFIKEQFCNVHVWFMLIRAINPLFKKNISVTSTTVLQSKGDILNFFKLKEGIWDGKVQCVWKVAVHLQKVLEVMSTERLYKPEPVA
jgi:hypothetical protein